MQTELKIDLGTSMKKRVTTDYSRGIKSQSWSTNASDQSANKKMYNHTYKMTAKQSCSLLKQNMR